MNLAFSFVSHVLIIPLWERITKGNFRRNCVKKNSKKARDAIYGNEQRGAEDDAAFAKPQQENSTRRDDNKDRKANGGL